MSSLAQRKERSPGVREFMGSIPLGDSISFFVPRSYHVDQFTFYDERKCKDRNINIRIAQDF